MLQSLKTTIGADYDLWGNSVRRAVNDLFFNVPPTQPDVLH